MIIDHILSLNIFAPLIGVFLILLILLFGSYNKQPNRLSFGFKKVWPVIIGFIFAAIPFIITLIFAVDRWREYFAFPMQEKFVLFANLNIKYFLSIDGLSICMMLLTAFLSMVCLVIYWKNKVYAANRPMLAVMMILILETCCLGAFSANDLILFYIFFEASLIPMLFIIGIWGRENRVYASLKLFIYTVFGSIFFLFAIIYLRALLGTTDLEELKTLVGHLAPNVQRTIWIAMFVAFAVKIPMLPFHTWLPDAHVQAPTFGSIFLAGILIKLGAYAMIKFLIPLFPEISREYSQYVALLSVIGIIYASLISLAQKDIKKLIAYSSIAHMGYVTLGIFIPCALGYAGASFQMISHGLISSALFMSVGFIYEKFHSLQIKDIHSLAIKMPFFATMFMIFTLGSVGLPGTSGFIGEFLVIVNAASRSGYFIYAILAATGVILGAVYMLSLYKKIFMQTKEGEKIGHEIEYNQAPKTTLIENSLLVIFAGLIIYFGLHPKPMIDKITQVKIGEYSNCGLIEIEKK